MRSQLGAGLLLIACLGVTPCATAETIEKPSAQEVGGKINWVYDYEKGKVLSKESGQPMFVVFRCER